MISSYVKLLSYLICCTYFSGIKSSINVLEIQGRKGKGARIIKSSKTGHSGEPWPSSKSKPFIGVDLHPKLLNFYY